MLGINLPVPALNLRSRSLRAWFVSNPYQYQNRQKWSSKKADSKPKQPTAVSFSSHVYGGIKK